MWLVVPTVCLNLPQNTDLKSSVHSNVNSRKKSSKSSKRIRIDSEKNLHNSETGRRVVTQQRDEVNTHKNEPKNHRKIDSNLDVEIGQKSIPEVPKTDNFRNLEYEPNLDIKEVGGQQKFQQTTFSADGKIEPPESPNKEEFSPEYFEVTNERHKDGDSTRKMKRNKKIPK